MNDSEDAQQLAAWMRSAIRPHAATCSLPLILWEKSLPLKLGTGILFQVAGETFIFTVNHHVKEASPEGRALSTVCPDDTRIDLGGASVVLTNDVLDIAIVTPTAEQAKAFLTHGFSPVRQEMLDVGYVQAAAGTQTEFLLVVYGFPAQGAYDNEKKHLVTTGMAMGCVPASVAGLNDFDARTHIAITYPDLDEPSVVTPEKGPQPPMDPSGLSGGGIWSLPLAKKGFWTPDDARLVAIQHSHVSDGRLRATYVAQAIELLSSERPDIAGALSLSVGGSVLVPSAQTRTVTLRPE